MLPVEAFDFAFLSLLMPLFRLLFRILLGVCLELCDPNQTSLAFIPKAPSAMLIDILFLCDNLPLYRLLIVWSPTCWTQTIHVVFDVVEAELADLV